MTADRLIFHWIEPVAAFVIFAGLFWRRVLPRLRGIKEPPPRPPFIRLDI